MLSLLNVTPQTSADTHACSMIVLRMMSFWHSLQYSRTFSCKLHSTVVNLLAYLRMLSICILRDNDCLLLSPVCPDCSSLIFWFQSVKSLKLRYWLNELSEQIFTESHFKFPITWKCNFEVGLLYLHTIKEHESISVGLKWFWFLRIETGSLLICMSLSAHSYFKNKTACMSSCRMTCTRN